MIDMDTSELVKDVRQHARENYEGGGWDFLVECWSDEDIVAAMGDAQSSREAIWNVSKILRIMDEQRTDIKNA